MDNYLNQVLGDRYEIKEIIGVGGMAVVYKAYDRVDDRIVAVKILKDEYLANEEFRRRFKNESKAISVLSHPNIVKVYDVSFGEKLQYIVMEHVEGITLKEYIQRQETVDWKEAIHFVIQILRALQHAHDKGIIHRDIKPQNILILPNASIKVTDFGIARFNRGEIRSVVDSGAIGSVHYVSPEQARGDYTDEKSDIYSVGVVIYEMLTGKLPFDSDNDDSVVLMQMQQDAEKPSAINPSVPLGLEQITLRAMQKNPADRYQSAAEFLLDLDEFKRNPLIKFDYSYFIDKNPTKYINTAVSPVPTSPVRIIEEDEEENDNDEYDDDTQEARNMTLPILTGVAISLVLIVGVIILFAFADPIKSMLGDSGTSQSQEGSFLSKLDVFGWFSSDKIEVPNFVNMTFEQALEKYPDLVIENPPRYEYNSVYEYGKICNQTPEAGEKVSKDTVIKLTVATSSEMVLISDVIGLNYVEAETTLRALGLKVELVPTTDNSAPEGEVLNTDPSINTYIGYQGTVYVYYATGSREIDTARVPNVIGDDVDIAKAKIKAAGLKIGSIYYDSSSPSLKDFVIGQDLAGGSSVNLGVYVNLVIGNGVPASATADITVELPKLDGSPKSTVKTFLNNNAYDIFSDVKLNGSEYNLSFTGSGEENTFKIYVDTTLIYTGTINFNTEPPTVANVVSYAYVEKKAVPNVVNLTKEKAIETLNAAGFTKITQTTQFSDTVAAGTVISQTPVYSDLAKYFTTTNITLVISLGPEGATEVDVPVIPPESTTKPPVETEETTLPTVQETTTEPPEAESTTHPPVVEETTPPVQVQESTNITE